jgi:SAM-dependent methyltransferase
MAKQTVDGLRRPRSDGGAVFDTIHGIYGGMALPIAHRRGLFRLLDGQRLTAAEIGEALALPARAAEALLAALTSLRMLELSEGRYGLTAEAEDYLLESSPTYFGALLDLHVGGDTLSYAAIDRAVATGSPQGASGDFASFEAQAERARDFTRAMHSISFGSALAWPALVELAGDEVLLDVGGGSGAHSIGACLRWPQLRAIVLDLSPVCDVAEEFVAAHGLAGQITTHRADMWDDPFPPADLHLYSNILHDWPREKGRFLVEKSFAALAPGGRILLHEALLDDDKAGPVAVAAFNMAILTWTEGQQYSDHELTEMLTAAGFRDFRITPAFHPFSVVEARRP